LTALSPAALGCASEPSSTPAVRDEDIEVVKVQDEVADGTDTRPHFTLALRDKNGARIPIEGRALAHVTFVGGIALVDAERRLIVVSSGGARRVLAEQAGAPPARGASGELVYVAQRDVGAELHVLDAGGVDRTLASGLASAGLLAPQPDGTILFVGARSGGVAGLWSASAGDTRCLTNCDLRTGQPWGERFVPHPGDIAAIRVTGERVERDAFDGKRYGAPLRGAQ